MTGTLEINTLEELKVADLACGSGHILNECFDLLLDLYVNDGYSRREAVECIFKHNLTGIDIDTRAKQLATFALLLKACQKDASFTDAHLMPHVLDMPENLPVTVYKLGTVHANLQEDPDGWFKEYLALLDGAIQEYLVTATTERIVEVRNALLVFNNCDSLGSIMKFDISDNTRFAIKKITIEWKDKANRGESVPAKVKLLMPYFEIMLALTEKYSALVMNPPYLPAKRMDETLIKYANNSYLDSKNDLFSIFMDIAFEKLCPFAKYGMINMQAWMYNKYFTPMRERILNEQNIDSLLHLGAHTFDELSGEIVQNVAFVISKQKPSSSGSTFFKLVSGKNCAEKELLFLDKSSEFVFENVDQTRFSKIKSSPMGSYWASDAIMKLFEDNPIISDETDAYQGLSTASNDLFIRLWHEIDIRNVFFNCENHLQSVNSNKKWYPCNKGGGQRKWYGNHYEVIDWEHDGYRLRHHNGAVLRAEDCHFKETVTWNMISGNYLTFRFYPHGFVLNNASNAIPVKDAISLLGFLSSKISIIISQILNATTNLSNGVVARFPLISIKDEKVLASIKECVSIAKKDWNRHETSWDYQIDELIEITDYSHLRDRVAILHEDWDRLFKRIHSNEEELNRQFIDIYGLQDELTPDVPLDEVTILQQGEISIENNEIVWHDDVLMKQFISYAVGCWMGRYRLDKPGLHIAHTDATSEEIAPYDYNGEHFVIDDDGIIPLMPKDSMFHDNAALRMADFVRQVFGADTQVDNLNFIEAALGKSLEQYFIKDFWKDHKKMYQNRPIYWLFSSKKGAFQCLAYMHRMDKYTAERVRQKYLLPHMEDLRKRIADLAERAASLNTQERRTLESLGKQLAECMEYHDRLHPIADRQIAFDLDDGVVVNYAKFGDILAKLK